MTTMTITGRGGLTAFIAARMIQNEQPIQMQPSREDEDRVRTTAREELIASAYRLAKDMLSLSHDADSYVVDVIYKQPYPPGNIANDFIELCKATDMSFRTVQRGVTITHNPAAFTPSPVTKTVHRGG